MSQRCFRPVQCALLLAWTLAGCGGGASNSNTSTTTSVNNVFPLPDYARLELEDVNAAAIADIEEHRGDVDALFAERERLPFEERFAIQAGSDAYTARQVNEELCRFRSEREVPAYLASTADTGGARSHGEEFLTQYFRYLYNQPDARSADQLKALAQSALDAGSDDPMVLCYQAMLRHKTGDEEGVLDVLLAQRPRLVDPRISRLTRVSVADWIWFLVEARNGNELVDREYRYGAIDAVVDFFASEADTPNQRLVWDTGVYLYNRLSREQQKEFLVACWSNGNVHAWITHWMAGVYYYDLAWDHRGTGFADTVTEEGWKHFEEYLGRAQDHLLRAWQLAPEHPLPAWKMIQVAMSGHSDRWSEWEWFYESTRAQLDWLPAYDALYWALTPRWGGSHGQQLKLADLCLDTGRHDTCVPYQATQILRGIHRETGDMRALAQLPATTALARRYAAELNEASSQQTNCPADEPGTWAYLASILIQAGDYDTVRMIFERHDDDGFGAQPLGWTGVKMSYARGLAFAMTGPARDNVTVFEEFLNQPLPEDVEPAVFDEMLELLARSRETDTQDESQPYYNDIEAVVRQLRDYHAGEWVDLAFDEQLSGFYVHAREFELQDGGALYLASTADAPGIQVQPLAHFPPPFVCEAEMALGVPEKRNAIWPGVIYGHANRNSIYATQQMRFIQLSPWENFAAIHDEPNYEEYHGKGTYLKNREFHLLRLKIWSNSVDYSADHEDIASIDMPEGAHYDQFAVGESQPFSNPTEFRVRRLRIRRLTHGPPPPRDDPERLLAFNLAERDNDPLDPNAWFHLGVAHFLLEHYQDALDTLAECERLEPSLLDPHYYQGASLLELRRLDEAIPHYHQFIQTHPEHMPSYSNLAWILAAAPDDELRNGAEALQLAQRACELSSYEHWMPLCALAAAHAELGDFAEARRWIDRSGELVIDQEREFIEQQQAEIHASRPLRIQPRDASGAETLKTVETRD